MTQLAFTLPESVPPPEIEFCHKCKTSKPVTDFHKCRWRKKGVHWWCKECRRTHETAKLPRATQRRRMPPDTDGNRLCSKCSEWKPIAKFRFRPDRPGKRVTICRECQAAIDLTTRTVRRMSVLGYYGLSCAYCGEQRISYLEIDHVHNDGKYHRMVNGDHSGNIVDYILKHNFPTGFQTLCTGCNLAKSRFSGEMPSLFREVGSIAWKQAIEWLVGQLGGAQAVVQEVQSLLSNDATCEISDNGNPCSCASGIPDAPIHSFSR